ncbi:hypothetical protein FA592_00830 [Sulfurospirillum diekertiae]|uniref:Uncharacterized protein n=1 Tax=Sulfurospirillum diekertiae TaxID=1854492 RepID=A0A6G9VMX5_9BACT|nr:hypothetical protein [Sulfurospirillum diekertiae]QIR74841.1 hypothetical protein FA584_00840 [Sulfurospirillum diekertiae]QIR77505.1 hypothetical protein FA592_00830 [Sulfurospirillum diekertiae]
MIEILKYGEQGITRWIDNLIKEITENPKEFISIARVHDGDKNYSFIALFKNKCTIGKYTALIHEWGTNDGMSGEGGRGFIRMNDFLSDNNIEAIDLELDAKDAKQIGYMSKGSIQDWEKRKEIWKRYVDKLSYQLL